MLPSPDDPSATDNAVRNVSECRSPESLKKPVEGGRQED